MEDDVPYEDHHAVARDRKRRSRQKMGVSGRSVFVLERLQREKGNKPRRGGVREMQPAGDDNE